MMMNDQHNDGGAAFPGPAYTQNGHLSGHGMGMSLRDWFAGQALGGMISGYYANADMCGLDETDHARAAYEYSDAMLTARGAK